MTGQIALTCALALPLLAFAHTWIGRNATAESGHIVNLVFMAEIALWAGWMTVAIIWLIWRT
jgi:hypothetical protein